MNYTKYEDEFSEKSFGIKRLPNLLSQPVQKLSMQHYCSFMFCRSQMFL